MVNMLERKVMTDNQVGLPLEVLIALDLRPGDMVRFVVEKDSVALEKKSVD